MWDRENGLWIRATALRHYVEEMMNSKFVWWYGLVVEITCLVLGIHYAKEWFPDSNLLFIILFSILFTVVLGLIVFTITALIFLVTAVVAPESESGKWVIETFSLDMTNGFKAAQPPESPTEITPDVAGSSLAHTVFKITRAPTTPFGYLNRVPFSEYLDVQIGDQEKRLHFLTTRYGLEKFDARLIKPTHGAWLIIKPGIIYVEKP